METSENINELAAALSKAQGKITGALKDSSNPFFKSKYADLASCWDACRQHLADNALSVIQTAEYAEGAGVSVTTMLAHGSGQWVRGKLTMFPKDNGPQAFGSALTYARRYALAAIVGVAQIDDDAEAGSGRDLLNGLPRFDPRGEGHKKQDLAKAQEYADRFRGALTAKPEPNKTLVVELNNECNADSDFYIAVSTFLTPPQRESIKKIIREDHAVRNGKETRQ